MIKIQTFTFNDFQENTYVLFDKTNECIIVDPGCYEKKEKIQLENFISDNKLKPILLVNTHCHIDHVLGNHFVSKSWNIPLAMHKLDLPTLKSVADYCSIYGFHNYEQSPEPKLFLKENDVINFGNSSLKVLFTPGHAPGHIVLHSSKQNFIIGGDVLFKLSIGRTDLPGGDHDTLIQSIKEKLIPLHDDTTVYCGHGMPTNIGFEKQNNPFIS